MTEYARYKVHYDVGTYAGDVIVWADTNAETDEVIAKAKRDVYRGSPPPAGLYSQRWRIVEKVEFEEEEENPSGKRRRCKPKPRLTAAERDVFGSLETAILDFPGLPRDEQTRQFFASDDTWKAANSLVKRGYADVIDKGTHRGNKWVVIRASDKGLRTLAANPAVQKQSPNLTVIVDTRRGTYTVDVGKPDIVGGVLAVHPSLRNLKEIARGAQRRPQSWTITHIPSGQMVATVRTREWAGRLAKQIVAFSSAEICSWDPSAAAQAIAGPGSDRLRYILHVSRQSFEPQAQRGRFPAYATWQKTAGELAANPEDLRSQAAIAAAVGALVGGLLGAAGGAAILGAAGAVVGAASFGASGAATGAAVGAAYGLPFGAYVGTIWGSVRQTRRALRRAPRHDADVAGFLAGLGAAVTGPLAPVGAGLGAYLGAPP